MKAIEQRLSDIGITLPVPAKPVANYVGWARTGNLVFTAGQVTLKDGKFEFIGKLGKDFTTDEGYNAARLCAVNIIAQLKDACDGDLTRVKRIVRLTGFVNGTAEFSDQSKVINGASDLMVEVFADRGKHARSAVGAGGLPFNVAVEVEAIAEIE